MNTIKESKTMKAKRKTPTAVFLIDDSNGTMYCNDGLFRNTVLFGTVSCCLKTWRKPGFAKRSASKLGLKDWTIRFAYAGDIINHDGTMTTEQ